MNLRRELLKTLSKAFAAGTVKNLKSQLKTFLRFCDLLQEECLPLSCQQLCLYIQYLSTLLTSPQSVRNYVCGVKTFHSMCNLPFPDYNNVLVRLTFKGVERSLQHVPHRAHPMSPELLCKIYQLLDMNVTTHVVIWCLFVFMFFLFARKSQFMCSSTHDIHVSKLVKRQDIQVSHQFLTVKFRWTKTRQSGGEPLIVPLSPITGSVLCPVLAYYKMLSLVSAPPSSPAFVLPSRTGLTPVVYEKFQKVLKCCVNVLGLDPSYFSSHSFRRGGASYAFACGVRGELIQRQGDWRSDAYKVYLDLSFPERVSVSNTMSRSLYNVH